MRMILCADCKQIVERTGNHQFYCKDCYLKHRKEKREYHRNYNREYRKRNRDVLNEKRRRWNLLNKNERKQSNRAINQGMKALVLTHYGNGKCSCVKCGFSDLRALSIDHIDGGGTNHRKKIHQSNFYWYLKEDNFPEGYQTLCMNCQFIKRDENKECRR